MVYTAAELAAGWSCAAAACSAAEARVRLRFGGAIYDRTLALMTGAVQPEGATLEYVADVPNRIFRRMFASGEFDASELSSSNFMIETARGDRRFVALPVFPSRAFRHNSIFVHADAGIERPEDLRGRRVGIPEYFQTANFWVRGFLQHDYGVAPEAIRWVRASGEKLDVPLPAGLDLVDAPAGRSLSDLLAAGEIDALIAPEKPACFVAGVPQVRRLFPDFPRVEAEYFRRTGYFPIMHLVVLRRDVYEQDRTLARRLYEAFVEAKARACDLLGRSTFLTSSLPFQVAHVEETRALFGDDPFPYGLERNRHTLAAIARYVHEQGVASRAVAIDELFAPELLDT
jgi:4,5-dihydroxyphthalate decarboxylase